MSRRFVSCLAWQFRRPGGHWFRCCSALASPGDSFLPGWTLALRALRAQ